MRIASGRLGKREKISKIVAFLGSDGAGYVAGQVIYAEGGLMMWRGYIV